MNFINKVNDFITNTKNLIIIIMCCIIYLMTACYLSTIKAKSKTIATQNNTIIELNKECVEFEDSINKLWDVIIIECPDYAND